MPATVQDVMTRDPLAIRHDAGLDEALAILLDEDAGEIYVVDGSSRLLGVLPDYELLKATLTGTPLTASVDTLMSRHLATVSPGTPTAEIAPLFRDCNHRRLPVVENGRLIGQITRRDLLRLLATPDRLPAAPESPEAEQSPDQPPATLRGPRYMQSCRPTPQRILQD